MTDIENQPTNEDPDAAVEGRALTRYRWDKEWKYVFLNALSTMPNVSYAARQAGISRGRVSQVRLDDPLFRAAWDEAKEVALDTLEAVIYRRGVTGEPVQTTRTVTKRDARGNVIDTSTTVMESNEIDTGAALAMLRAQRPKVWGDKVQHTGADDGPIVLEVYRHPDRDRMRALVEIAARLGLPPSGNPDTVPGEVVGEEVDDAGSHAEAFERGDANDGGDHL